jgi:hypothetical protein
MKTTFLFTLAVLLSSATLWAQSTTTTSSGSTQATINNLAPASNCFICECNSQDFTCRTACASITDFATRQQCEAACGQQQSTCLSNAQVQQRAVDTQRLATQTTIGTVTTSTSTK